MAAGPSLSHRRRSPALVWRPALLVIVLISPLFLAGCMDSSSSPLLPSLPGNGNDNGDVQSLAARIWLQGGTTLRQADGWEVYMVPRSIREQLDLEGELSADNVREASVGAGATNPLGFFRISDIPAGYQVLSDGEGGPLGIADGCVTNDSGQTFCFEKLETDTELCISVDVVEDDTELCVGGVSQDDDPWDVLDEKHVLALAPHVLLILASGEEPSHIRAQVRLKDAEVDPRTVEVDIHDHGTGQLLDTRAVEVTAQGSSLEYPELGTGRFVITPREDRFFHWGAMDFYGVDPEEPAATADDSRFQDITIEASSLSSGG